MAETPVPITTGNGSASIAGDLVSGNTYQQIKLVDGTIGGNTPLSVNADGSITASIYGNINTSSTGSIAAVIIGGSIAASFTAPANQSVSGTVGASIIGIVPVNIVGGASVVATFTPAFVQPSSLVSGVTSVITGTTSVQVLIPAPAGQRNYITNVLVTNAAAVGTTVELFDAGNVIYTGFAAASGGGFSASFPTALKQ